MLPAIVHLTQPISLDTQISAAGGQPKLTSLVLHYASGALPAITYWGPALPPTLTEEDMAQVGAAQQAQILGAGLETEEKLSLLPTQAEGWTGTPLISVQRNGHEIFPCFHTTAITAIGGASGGNPAEGSPAGQPCAPSCESTAETLQQPGHSTPELTPGSAGCTIHATDPQAELDLSIEISIDAGGLVSQRATLTNSGTTPLSVGRLWLTMPLPAGAMELWTHTGHHMRERAPQRQPFTEGVFAKETWMGRPDFTATLLMSAGTPGFTWESGDARAVHLAWSGNSTHFAIRTPYSQGLIGAGEALHPGEIILQPGECYNTPELVASWGEGMNEVAARYHARLRAQHPDFATRPRPVTLNTWEAVYFDHDEARMMELARRAAEIGVERFVIDDGWFKGRRNDTRALGDWQVDTTVWPRGLSPIAQLVHELGMEFGLWFEPEMVCLDSDVARAHPEWVLRPHEGRLPLPGRDQYVLDLANPQAWEYLYTQISALVEELGIDYIKWDHNRWVSEAISPFTGRPAIHGQTLALYRLLDALRADHPRLEIESCSSGGGRIDLGILARTDRVWASDCTDPLERVDIQRHTSVLVPPEMMGAHIAQSPSHMTGRHTYLTTRACVALGAHLGVEWNILSMDEEEAATLAHWIELHKRARQRWTQPQAFGDSDADVCGEAPNPGAPNCLTLLNGARLIHTSSTDPSVRLSGLCAPSGEWSLWSLAYLTTSEHYPYGLVRMPGLDASAMYRIRPYGGPDLYAMLRHPSCRSNLEWWNEEGLVVPGAMLSNWGVRPPQLLPGAAVLIEVEKVS